MITTSENLAPKQKSELAKLIRQFRMDNDMTQIELAKSFGTSQAIISAWETDKYLITIPHLDTLAQVLKLNKEKREALLLARLPALNSDWLSKQPKEEHAGLVEHAIRQVFGKHSHDLAFQLEKRVSDLIAIDTKHEPIAESMQQKLEQYFSGKSSQSWGLVFKGALADYFAVACEQSRHPEKEMKYPSIEFSTPSIIQKSDEQPIAILNPTEFEIRFDAGHEPKFTR